ncbi:hypothetical protein [Oceanobacillus jeddahense]|uniref:hypothetical protein n=1 Tax=Oceanobacillus jeddahense TaxID=1462527 RepID=UPI000595B3B4|nr:hypothetical protein [Oceanobacillus jeddahense]
MTGDVKDTLTKGYTEYRLEYGEDTFIIKKPFMSEKNYCELKKVTGEHIATHKKQVFFTFKREIELSDACTDLDNGIFLLTLSLIIFIS